MNSPELDEVLKKIGRNVLVLQRIEAMLKYIIPRVSIGGSLDTLKSNHEKAVRSISQQTMGNLVKRFMEDVCNKDDAEEKGTESVEMFSVSIKLVLSEDSYKAKSDSMERLVHERNQLIHHMLSKFDQNCLDSCGALSKRLDTQYELVTQEYEELRRFIEMFHEAYKAALDEIENGFKNS